MVLNGNSGQESGALTFWSEARVINSGGKQTPLKYTLLKPLT